MISRRFRGFLVAPDVKFCGLTCHEDAVQVNILAARYSGVIFAGGPRHQTVETAATVFSGAPSVKRVAVVAEQSVVEIVSIVRTLSIDVVQLHGDPSVDRLIAVRNATGAEVWAVVRLAGSTLPPGFDAVASSADAVVLDARVPGGRGGSGVALPWAELAESLDQYRGQTRIVLAGGLRAENVAEAIAALKPDVVDVSSGVESAPGIKDHERMRAFRDAVHRAGADRSQ